jgi:hypothetical protein
MNAEVAEPSRLLQLFRGDRYFHAALGQVARLQVLHGIEGRAGAQRCEQQLGRCHSAVLPAVVGRLIADNGMRSRLNGKFHIVELRNLHFHRDAPLH